MQGEEKKRGEHCYKDRTSDAHQGLEISEVGIELPSKLQHFSKGFRGKGKKGSH